MRLGQIQWNGAATAAIFNHTSARPIPDYTLCALISRAEKIGATLTELAEDLSIPKPVAAEPLIPLQPREVWSCGAPRSGRTRISFKGTARVCVGPGDTIGIRRDSNFTAVEANWGVVLGARGRVLGYTLANDVSALDLELAQARTFRASCALGPIMVTPDELTARELTVSCTIARAGETIFTGEVSAAQFGEGLCEAIDALLRANPVPAGSVLLASAGIAAETAALAAGDSVTIRMEHIGELTNRAEMI